MGKFIVGLVGTFGSGCTYIAKNFFADNQYKYISLSEILREEYKAQHQDEDKIKRTQLQDFGDKIRKEKGCSYLAEKAYEKIEQLSGDFWVVDSIRNPEEINFFKRNYVDFYVFAIFADKDMRWERIKDHYNSDQGKFEADEIRDKGEKFENGQRVTDCFLLADVIVINNERICGKNDSYFLMSSKINKYLDLLQRKESNRMPTDREAIMAIAYANSMRSSCLKRKVGAVIVDENGYVFSSGYNEVPPLELPCKNQYGECYRNFAKNDVINLFAPDQEVLKSKVLGKVKLLEKCRALHAEENAILNIAKSGSANAVKNSTLYTTTYPCNLCANKIAQVNIKKIVYFEPYPVEEAKKTLSEAGIEQEMFEGITYNSYFKVYGEIIL